MGAKTNIDGADNYVLQEAIGAYADEAYTNEKSLVGTGLVGSNPDIDRSTETYKGQLRWFTPITDVTNTASLTDPTAGTTSDYGSDYLTYIKTVRTYGAKNVNLKKVVTQVDGLAKIGRDLAQVQNKSVHNSLLAVLKGVAISEMLNGAASGSGQAGLGGQTFSNDPTDKRYGFYVDLGASSPIIAATAAQQGAARAEAFLQAFGKAWKDYEPDYAYLVTSPEVMASLRSANLIDADRITEGNINFESIFNGKLRLIQTRANQGFTAAEMTQVNKGLGVDIVGTKTSFIVLPGSLAFEELDIELPTEVTRDGSSYQGGGSSVVWYRWGQIIAPKGYDWVGYDEDFPKDIDYTRVFSGTVLPAATRPAASTLATIGSADNAGVYGTWKRKTSSALTLGILPIFHS